MKALAGLGIVLSIVGCRVVQDSRSVVIMQPHEGTYLWISPESRDKLGAGGELQIYMDPHTHPEAKASFAKFTLGVGGQLPVHRHDRTEEISYFLSGEGVVVVVNEEGAEKEIPVGTGYVWYNPPGVWHTVRNTGPTPLSLVFVTVPNEKTGLLSYFRRVCAGPGEEGLVLSPEELEKLASEHDLILRSSGIHER